MAAKKLVPGIYWYREPKWARRGTERVRVGMTRWELVEATRFNEVLAFGTDEPLAPNVEGMQIVGPITLTPPEA